MKCPLIVAIAGRKGGSGKTTLTLALAAHYIRAKKHVCIIDLDPQASATMGLRGRIDGTQLTEVFAGTAEPVPVEVGHWERLTLICGGPEMEAAESRNFRATLAKMKADIVLLDCPPGFPRIDRAALMACDSVIVASEPHAFAVAGAIRVINAANGIKREGDAVRIALVLTRVDPRRALDKDAAEILRPAINVPLFTVHQDTSLAAALHNFQVPPASGKAAEDLKAVAKWLSK